MKLNVADLRAAVETAAKAHRERWDETEAARFTDHIVASKAWVQANAAAWRDACTDIREALKRGKPVTVSMLPRDGNRYGLRDLAVFVQDPPEPRPYPGPGQALRRMQVALSLITDAEVTTTALQGLGVSPSVLRDVLDLMPNPAVAK